MFTRTTVPTITTCLLLALSTSCTCIGPQDPPNDDTSEPADGDSEGGQKEGSSSSTGEPAAEVKTPDLGTKEVKEEPKK